KYGYDVGLDALKQQIKKDKRDIAGLSFTSCMKDALYDCFGVNAVQAAFNGGLAYYLEKKLWNEAAKIGVKFFIGSSV
ncbi:hypothetical protein N3944_34350, partial [Bacillus thuringiensis]|nr:hypothetical protein [Bacillus thuringiensis]